jgi:hypothetical protein
MGGMKAKAVSQAGQHWHQVFGRSNRMAPDKIKGVSTLFGDQFGG